MNRKDTYRNYAIWALLLLFYGVFYYLNNYAWIEEIPVTIDQAVSSSQMVSMAHSAHIGDTTIVDPAGETELSSSDQSSPVTDDRPPRYYSATKNAERRASRRNKTININAASTEEWQELYGIGPYRSERIVHFRTALGGFYSIDQVGETYGLPDSVFREIKSRLILDSTWQNIDINSTEYDSLYLHPYITKQMAYFMVRHRDNTAPIRSMEDLFGIIPEKDHERLRKLEPYLNFGIK